MTCDRPPVLQELLDYLKLSDNSKKTILGELFGYNAFVGERVTVSWDKALLLCLWANALALIWFDGTVCWTNFMRVTKALLRDLDTSSDEISLAPLVVVNGRYLMYSGSTYDLQAEGAPAVTMTQIAVKFSTAIHVPPMCWHNMEQLRVAIEQADSAYQAGGAERQTEEHSVVA